MPRDPQPLTIGSRRVGPGASVFIIAEAGVNHDGRLEQALQLVDAAADVGADAVKFQTFETERLVARQAPQYEMLRRLELSAPDHRALQSACRRRDILFLSSPFDEHSADLLEALGVEAFKVPSGELTNLSLVTHVAAKGKPVILSTGMAVLDEVRAAVAALEAAGNRQAVLLHCVSRYPAQPHEANLRAMQTLADAFALPVGYSDHTLGIDVALAAVALGACVIEKHLTLDATLPGPDHHASLPPHEFSSMVCGIRTVEAALGHGRKEPAVSEADTAAVARKSLVAARQIQAGAVVTDEALAVKRPGTGLPPAMKRCLVGRRAVQDIPVDTVLTLEMFSS